MLDFGFYNLDCMEGMKEFPDNYFELAIVDPEYGIGAGEYSGFDKVKRKNGTVGHTKRASHKKKCWDSAPPDFHYFAELERVSCNRIIWGGNYFKLPPTRGIISWDKCQPFKNFSAFELAWTSFDKPAKIFKYDNKGFMNPDGSAIHPTQKPVALYRWLLQNYAKAGDKILDTHVGSASSLIAFEKEGFDYVGFELDEDYFRDATKRLKQARITTIDMFKEPKKQILENEEIVF